MFLKKEGLFNMREPPSPSPSSPPSVDINPSNESALPPEPILPSLPPLQPSVLQKEEKDKGTSLDQKNTEDVDDPYIEFHIDPSVIDLNIIKKNRN